MHSRSFTGAREQRFPIRISIAKTEKLYRRNNHLTEIFKHAKELLTRQTQTFEKLDWVFVSLNVAFERASCRFSKKNTRLVLCQRSFQKANQMLFFFFWKSNAKQLWQMSFDPKHKRIYGNVSRESLTKSTKCEKCLYVKKSS